jgi:beta-lactamase superfamily II metal-dependent hydrolase
MPPRKPAKKKVSGKRLLPPKNGAVVRMYRIGHGDCFLLAFATGDSDKPAYVLIDCGYKPGSPGHINTSAKEITDSIREATAGRLDIVVITHEHQDHVNAISAERFKDFEIGQAWFAWTENPEDDVANDLREQFRDKLVGLMAARKRLAAVNDDKAKKVSSFLAFELGGENEDKDFNFDAAMGELLGATATSSNKKSMKVFKDLADDMDFLKPHHKIETVPGTDVRVFVLGPPRDPDQLKSLDPVGDEEFHLSGGGVGAFFAAVANRETALDRSELSPIARRYHIPFDLIPAHEFLEQHYGAGDGEHPAAPDVTEVPPNAKWRRIDNDWLYSAEQLALDLNDQTNNSSLVLAFELGKGGKVLLFAADAQRGNWRSWTKKNWRDGDAIVTARDLLSRTVLYKVGHHGSHNATLNGLATDEYANLAWMGQGSHAREFTAMITAVRSWAETQKGWDHPLKAIKDALLKKASGRVFQTDTDFEKMKAADEGVEVDWSSFTQRASGHRLYFDYVVES